MINSWLLFLIATLLLCSTLMLVQPYITSVIKLLVVQNGLLAIYLLTQIIYSPDAALLASLAMTTIVKVIVLPFLLWKLTRFLQLSGRIEPSLNKPVLLVVAAIFLLFALFLGHKMINIIPHTSTASFSIGLANTFVAVLLILFRRKTVTQVIGLLVLENSIFILAAALSTDFPWLIELGMSFDILMGFMIFVLFLMRMQREQGSFEVRHFEKLKERV